MSLENTHKNITYRRFNIRHYHAVLHAASDGNVLRHSWVGGVSKGGFGLTVQVYSPGSGGLA